MNFPGIKRKDEDFFLVSWSMCLARARERQSAHDDQSDERIRANARGIAGELAFAAMFNCDADLGVYAGGDGGRDFSFTVQGSVVFIDVKAALTPKFLLLKAASAADCADILVLARVSDPRTDIGWIECGFIGWDTRDILRLSPRQDFGLGLSHKRAVERLRPMADLRELLQFAAPHHPTRRMPA